jgi:hypothetical protein
MLRFILPVFAAFNLLATSRSSYLNHLARAAFACVTEAPIGSFEKTDTVQCIGQVAWLRQGLMHVGSPLVLDWLPFSLWKQLTFRRMPSAMGILSTRTLSMCISEPFRTTRLTGSICSGRTEHPVSNTTTYVSPGHYMYGRGRLRVGWLHSRRSLGVVLLQVGIAMCARLGSGPARYAAIVRHRRNHHDRGVPQM